MEKQQRSLLIIDDEETVLFAFKDVLSESWLEVDTAQTLDEAKRLLDSTLYHGAVVDLRLSGSEGTEGFEAIRMIKKRYPHCKIILLTAYAKNGTKNRAFSEGADFFLEKPVSPEEIGNLFSVHGVI